MSENNYNTNNEELYCDVIGIDLGTTNTIGAGMKSGNVVELFASREGSDLLPSCVSFYRGQELVGHVAAAKKAREPKNTVFDAKRFIGMEYDAVMRDLVRRYYQFSVVDGGGQRPLFSVVHNGEQLLKRPQDISAMILKRVRETAERSMKGRATDVVRLTKAVITVPAYFSMSQKRATVEAARIAGFEQVKLITEPAAAAYAYGFGKQRLDGYRILVFDLGGGTFDVTVLDVNQGKFVQQAIDGDVLLGGRDLDILLREYCAGEIKQRWNYDYMANSFKAQQLLELCEELKCNLSESTTDSLNLDVRDRCVELTVSRTTLELLCKPKLMEAVYVVNRLLRDNNFAPSDIDEVLLVGGATRMPLVKNLLVSECCFTANQINESENRDMVVAKGAAILAAQISETFKPNTACMELTEAIPLSIGADSMSKVFVPIIPRNSPIPSSFTHHYTTATNDQTSSQYNFYEGERKLVRDNTFLGALSIDGLPPGMAGSVRIELIMEIDHNGLLIAKANYNGRTVVMDVDGYEQRKSTDRSVTRALRDAELYGPVDAAEKRRLLARNGLELAIERSTYKCGTLVRDICAEFKQWLKENYEGATKELFDGKHEELKCRLGASYRPRPS